MNSSYILNTLLGLGGAAVIYALKALIMNRLDKLEASVEHTMTEQEVRTLLSDKLDPIQTDIKDIKSMQNNILDLLLKKTRE